MMKYKGYTGDFIYDDATEVFCGEVIYLTRDAITFQSTTAEEIEQAFKDSVDDYLEWVAGRGLAPEKPASVEEICLQIPKNSAS